LRDLDALHDLGAWHGSGDVFYKSKAANNKIAIKCYHKAAMRGHPESQYDLAFMYYAGEINDVSDLEKAKYWFEKSAANGYEPAIEFLREVPFD